MNPNGQTLKLEELKKRMSKAQSIQIDSSGKLINPEETQIKPVEQGETNQTQTPGGLRLKPTRWFAAHWYETLPGRLLIEKQAMQKCFPQFELVKDEEQLAWVGTLESNRNNQYEIAVMYPYDFPSEPPKVYPLNPPVQVFDERTLRTRHQYPDGHLCLYYPQDRSFNATATAATVVGVAAAWFFAYESWLESGKSDWPGDEVD
jgi:ubiquitin-protein ligase